MSPKDNSNKTVDGNKKPNQLKKKKTEQDKKKKVVTLEEAMKTVRVIDNKKQFYSQYKTINSVNYSLRVSLLPESVDLDLELRIQLRIFYLCKLVHFVCNSTCRLIFVIKLIF